MANQPNIEAFRAGLTACLRSWSALRTAVEAGWGGAESQAKADDLRQYILQHMDGSCNPPKGLDQHDLEDNLAIYMEEEFSVTLEDGSERQVADAIFRLYDATFRGDTSLAQELVAAADGAVALASAFPSQIQSNEHDDDDEEMEDESAPVATTAPPTLSIDYSSQPLFGDAKQAKPYAEQPVRQLGETMQEEKMVEVDDDGFAPVSSRRKKAR